MPCIALNPVYLRILTHDSHSVSDVSHNGEDGYSIIDEERHASLIRFTRSALTSSLSQEKRLKVSNMKMTRIG